MKRMRLSRGSTQRLQWEDNSASRDSQTAVSGGRFRRVDVEAM